MGLALEGIRVLDFSQMMFGPWCTQFLGDMGADIIKIERPGVGDWERTLPAMGELLEGESVFFLAMNRNKRSLSLNLKDCRARDIVYKLVRDADLLVENYRPGVMDRLGLGYEDLRAVNPSIVYVSGSGFGPSGPYVKRPGQDLLIQAMSGIAAHGGRCGDPPTPAGTSIVDASSALLMAFSAMVGLFHRFRTGQGQRIDVDLFSTALAVQCQEMAAFLNLDKSWERSRTGAGSPWLAAPFGIYRTQNGSIAIAMASLTTLGELVDLPELSRYDTPEQAYDARDTIKPTLAARISENTTEYWIEVLGRRDIWCAPVQEFDDVVRDPQVEHKDLIVTMKHPRFGELKVIGVPMTFSGTPGTIRLGPPEVGEHTDAILGGLGYSEHEIAALREEGVI